MLAFLSSYKCKQKQICGYNPPIKDVKWDWSLKTNVLGLTQVLFQLNGVFTLILKGVQNVASYIHTHINRRKSHAEF